VSGADWPRLVRAHGAEYPGEEVCGFVLRHGDTVHLLRAVNIAQDRTKNALPDAASVRLAHEADEIFYAYHTHTDDALSEEEAAADQSYCDAFGVPYLIVSPARARILEPTPPWQELVGRPWSWETHNCLHLCLAFADRVQGIKPDRALPQFAEANWPPPDRDVFRDLAESAGLAVLPWGAPRRFGDWLSFRVPMAGNRAPTENHLGVWTGTAMLHVPHGGLSCLADEDEFARLARYGAHLYRWKVLA
jgi:hypothetical protein